MIALDALAIAVGYWVEAMARDVDKAMQETQERRIESALQSFMEHVLDYNPTQDTWM